MKRKSAFLFLIASMILPAVWGFGCEHTTPSPSAIATTPEASPTIVASPTCALWSPPTWHGITPGKTSKQEVLQILGEPNTIKVWDNLESLHYFPYDSFADTFYRVIIRDGIVDMLYVESENGEQGKVQSECIRCYSYEPESEREHQEGSTTATVELYPRCGVAFVRVVPRTVGILYFVPMTLDEYRNRWGRYYPGDDPVSRPFPGLPDTAGVVAGQTTREQVIQLYGQPDYRETTALFGFPPGYDRAKGDLEVIYYQVPGTIERTHWFLFAFDDHIVQMIVINRAMGDLQYTLGDVVAKLGAPEIVYERPNDRPGLPKVHGPTFRKLCYPTKGLTVEGLGDEEPGRTDEVWYIYYYVPMSVEDYKNSWDGFPGPSAPIKWEGFADS